MSHMNNTFVKLILVVAISLVGFWGCQDNQYPSDIWNPNDTPNPDPVITQVFPSDSAFAGADILYIHGDNFSANSDDIMVFFNSYLGEILEANDTLLTVSPPSLTADSITIKVAVQGAYLFGEYFPYKLYPRLVEYGTFDSFEESIYGITTDTEENLLLGLSAGQSISIEKLLAPYGERIYQYLDLTPYNLGIVPKCLILGSNQNIYFTDGGNPYLIQINLISGGLGYAVLPGLAIAMDFDVNGNLFAGGSGQAVYLITSNMSVSVAKPYEETNITALRVFNNHVYVAGKYSGDDPSVPSVGVWRNEILSETGELGETMLILDWTGESGTEGNITSLTFDINGNMFLSSDEGYGVMTLSIDGNLEPYYPKIISPPITKLEWGTGNYLYMNYKGENKAIHKIDTRVEGAPYYGRQ